MTANRHYLMAAAFAAFHCLPTPLHAAPAVWAVVATVYNAKTGTDSYQIVVPNIRNKATCERLMYSMANDWDWVLWCRKQERGMKSYNYQGTYYHGTD
jgi:hypothetical protein